MKQQAISRTFGILVLVLLLSSMFAYALPQDWSLGANQPPTDSSLSISEPSLFEQIINSIFSVTGIQSSYTPGQTVTFTGTQKLTVACPGPAQLISQVYSGPTGSQTSANYKSSLSGSAQINNPIVNQNYQTTHTFSLPLSATGTWSISSFIYCEGLIGQYTNANQYSTVNEVNLNIASPSCPVPSTGLGYCSGNILKVWNTVSCSYDQADCTSSGKICGTASGQASCVLPSGDCTYQGTNIPRGTSKCVGTSKATCSSTGSLSVNTLTSNGCYPGISGACGTTNNICTTGTTSDQTDSATNYLWQCVGSNGGTTASCNLAKSTPPPAGSVNIQVVGTPSIAVSGNQVTGTIVLKNTGTATATDYIAELDVLNPADTSAQAVVALNPTVCDSSRPNNVNKKFTIGPGEQQSITLISPLVSSQGIAPGTYTSGFLVFDKCSYLGGVPAQGIQQIYNWGLIAKKSISITATGGTVDPLSRQCNLNNICEQGEECNTCSDCVSGKSGYDIKCSDGGGAGDGPNFQVQFVNSAGPLSVQSNGNLGVTVQVKNLGGKGRMNVETGIYRWGTNPIGSKDQVQSVAPLLIDNCEPTETNVQTYEVELDVGETKTVDFVVKAPDTCQTFGVDTTAFGLKTAAYINCYNTGLATGVTSQDFNELTIINQLGDIYCPISCHDGIQNILEPDTDCGLTCVEQKETYTDGSPKLCRVGYGCFSNADCESDSICVDSGWATGPKKLCKSTLTDEQQKAKEDARKAEEEKLAKSSCPNIEAAAKSGTCIPADCPYIDLKKTGLANSWFGGTTTQTSVCCSGTAKVEQTSKDFSLKWVGAGAGGLTGFVSGLFVTKIPSNTITTLTTGLGSVGGYYVGEKLYTDIQSQGVCQSQSDLFGGADFSGICQLNFINKWFPNCAAGLFIEGLAIMLLFKFL